MVRIHFPPAESQERTGCAFIWPAVTSTSRMTPRSQIGWVAQWNELMADPETRLSRPRQLYIGPAERAVVPAAERAKQPPLGG